MMTDPTNLPRLVSVRCRVWSERTLERTTVLVAPEGVDIDECKADWRACFLHDIASDEELVPLDEYLINACGFKPVPVHTLLDTL
jgi:hypothetical protein